MELFFKEKFSFKGKSEITDMDGNVVYTSKNGGFWVAKTFLMDNNKKKLAYIVEKNGLFNKGFVITVGKKKIAKIKKKFSLINQKFHVNKLEWDIKGNFTSKEYTITKGDELIATVKRAKTIALLEGYSVDIVDPANAETVMCVVLVLNNILKSKKLKLFK